MTGCFQNAGGAVDVNPEKIPVLVGAAKRNKWKMIADQCQNALVVKVGVGENEAVDLTDQHHFFVG